jgi:hypothetical protein
MKKHKEAFLKMWRDTVWSKVIATGILGLIALIGAKLTHHSWNDIYLFIIDRPKEAIQIDHFLFLYNQLIGIQSLAIIYSAQRRCSIFAWKFLVSNLPCNNNH